MFPQQELKRLFGEMVKAQVRYDKDIEMMLDAKDKLYRAFGKMNASRAAAKEATHAFNNSFNLLSLNPVYSNPTQSSPRAHGIPGV